MQNANEFDKLREKIKQYGNNIAVLEEEIDLKLQMQYFKESKAVKRTLDQIRVMEEKNLLFESTYSIESKRILLSQLASVNEVEAFRTLELYSKKPDASLSEWSILAYQESKMLLQSSFMDQPPLFISTGLGGKGMKLRYFIVVKAKEGKVFSEVQEQIISSEFDYAFRKEQAELEEVKFYGYIATICGLIPIDAGLKELFQKIVNNCNSLGGFLDSSFIVTNARKLSIDEIERAIENSRNREKSNNGI